MNDIETRFDPRAVNVLAIKSSSDASILIAECDYALGQIASQHADAGFSKDREWKAAAERAANDIMHKKSMAIIKRDAMEKREAELSARPKPSADDMFKARFERAARKMLPAATYEDIVTEAKLMALT
jgi:hypothetical protein